MDRNKELLESHEGTKRKREVSIRKSKKEKDIKTKLPSSFKEVPNDLKKHFPEDHVILQIKPDGTCGISCGSGHIFAEPTEGDKFRRQLNKHMVSNWEYYKDKIDFPYQRQIGANGKTVSFSEPIDLQNFLLMPDADTLWTDAEEVLAMCNMYQMTTNVVKVLGNNKPPTIVQVKPDPDIKKLGLSNTTMIDSGKVPLRPGSL